MNDERTKESWLDGKARQAMIDNGFEPEFSDMIGEQLEAISRRDLIAEAKDAKDLRDTNMPTMFRR